MKIRPLGITLFYPVRQTDIRKDVHTDMTKKIVISLNFAKVRKSCQFGSRTEMKHILKQSWKYTLF
jgi:hypothetical protein